MQTQFTTSPDGGAYGVWPAQTGERIFIEISNRGSWKIILQSKRRKLARTPYHCSVMTGNRLYFRDLIDVANGDDLTGLAQCAPILLSLNGAHAFEQALQVLIIGGAGQ